MSWEISLIGLALTVFTLINILTKSYRHNTDWLLIIWLLLLNIPFVHAVSAHLNFANPVLYRYTNPTLNLLQGPFLYLYVRMLVSREKIRLRTSDLIHFIPFGLLYCLFFTMSHSRVMMPQPDRLNTDAAPVAENGIAALSGLIFTHFGLINVLFFIGYSIVTIYTLKKHQNTIAGIFSQNDNQISLKWIYALPGTFVVLAICNMVYESYFSSSNAIHPLTLHLLSFLCFSVLLCFFGVKQKPVFQFERPQTKPEPEPEEIVTEDNSLQAEEITESSPAENKSNESEAFITQTVEKMQSYMQQEKPYLDPDFSVYTLADALGVPRRTLSLVLSTGLSKNFYQYVNEFRIEEVKVQLECQDNKSTILDIAFQAGFKSKSSFNSLFKQHCNLTPSQYRKMVKQQNS